MDEAAATSEGMAHFPPGAAVPKAADREAERIERLKDPDHLRKLNEGRQKWLALPEEERSRITAERKAEKAARAAAREARRTAKHGGRASAESAPPTVRSQRSTLKPAPDSEIPRPGVVGGQLRGLLDLCAALQKLGDGSCFIQVNRLKPVTAFGVQTAGVQKQIWEPIDDAEFALMYGGAEYQLRGYAINENGKAKALTEPVVYRVSGPPNLESALDEEDVMRPQPTMPNGGGGGFRRPGLVTPHVATAEADMLKTRLSHEERRDERNAQRAAELRREQEEREREKQEGNLNVARLLQENKEKEMERLDQAHQRELSLAAQNNKGAGMADVAKLLEVLKPTDNGQAAAAAATAAAAAAAARHADEIKQMADGHKGEVIRLTDQHRQELTRLTASHTDAIRRVEDQARADRERSDKLVRDTEQRASELVREAERRADARVTDIQGQSRSQYDDLRTRSEERLNDQNGQWQRRFDDIKENHAREIRQKDSELTLMRTGLEGNMTVILQGKDAEIKRLQHEVRVAKDESEKNKDWVGKMKELGEQAEVLGYVKPEAGEGGGDDDVKTIAMKAGFQALTRLPETISSIAQTIQQVRNPGVPPELARAQARAGAVRSSMRTVPRTMGAPPPLHLAPLPFATEDGGYMPPTDQEPPRPRQVQVPREPAPLPALEQSPTQAIIPMPQEQEPPPQPVQQPPMQPPPPPLQPAQQQAPVSIGVPPVAAAPAPVEIDPGVRAIVEQFAPNLAAQFEQRVAPEEVARQIIAENSPEMIRGALGVISIEQLLWVINQNPGAHASLVTRNGQKFLREIWRSAEQQVSAA